mmetsp:Transcript_13886/g.21165  ORF Transcript_13886/g.21165 Transcript_13886/m.21165 type:complete len:106 (-) Transcript_13886:93-410(-)
MLPSVDVPKYAVAMSDNIDNSISVVNDVALAVCQMQQLPAEEGSDGVTFEVDFDGMKDTIIGREGEIESIDIVEVPVTPPPTEPTGKKSRKIRNVLRMNKKKYNF